MTPLADRVVPRRVVACLNVWNDRAALEHSVPTWKPFVDHVIAVDGSYDTIGSELSTDGTREFLQEQFESIEIIDAAGQPQCVKRTRYCEHAQEGDFLFVIDADEHVIGAKLLCELPSCDVGWIRMRNRIYAREYGQPRIFRWRPGLSYNGRHHWLFENTQIVCTHQYGGPGYAHRPVNLLITNERGLGRDHRRFKIKSQNLVQQARVEACLTATPRTIMSDASIGRRDSLWILNYAYRDDGIAPSRFHTAINRTTPHSSVFFKSRSGPFGVPTQFDVAKDRTTMMHMLQQCDVLHAHVTIHTPYDNGRNVARVLHHHGSVLRANAEKFLAEAKRMQALVLVSNLELLSHTGDYPAFFLPNVVPVARYTRLAEEHGHSWTGDGFFRISHSPTKAERKGTAAFLAACKRLVTKGIPVAPVLIENQSHAQTLLMKSTCHAAFDSFWLGIQCSGLEAAGMGQPVIAGDPLVAERYREHFGSVPYTYANSEEELEIVIQRLIEDSAFRHAETERVTEYVAANHDESAVSLLYLDLLDMAFGWRDAKKRNGALPGHSRLRAVP